MPNAKKKQGEDFDLIERRRVIKLPDRVDKENVVCFIGEDGSLFISAPYVEMKPAKGECTSTENQNLTAVNSTSCETNLPASETATKSDTAQAEARTIEVIHEKSEETATPQNEARPTGLAQDSTLVKEPETTETTEEQACSNLTEDDILPSVRSLFEESCQEKTAPASEKSTTPVSGDGSTAKKINEEEDINAMVQSLLDLKPLEASVRRTDDGLNKRFEVSLNMKDFSPENIAIRFVDDDLCIDAQQELKRNGVHTLREVHRKFKVPEDGILDAARANVNSSGIVNVIVPLNSRKEESKTIPIVTLSQ